MVVGPFDPFGPYRDVDIIITFNHQRHPINQQRQPRVEIVSFVLLAKYVTRESRHRFRDVFFSC